MQIEIINNQPQLNFGTYQLSLATRGVARTNIDRFNTDAFDGALSCLIETQSVDVHQTSYANQNNPNQQEQLNKFSFKLTSELNIDAVVFNWAKITFVVNNLTVTKDNRQYPIHRVLFLATNRQQNYVVVVMAPEIVNGQLNPNTNYIMSPQEFVGLCETQSKDQFGVRNNFPQDEDNVNTDDLNMNTIFYGPPGTGKTYGLTEAVKNITGIEGDINGFNDLQANDEVKAGQIEFITFHQSYAYEDFIEGISAKVTKGQVEYYVKNGLFKTMCRRALAYKLLGDKIDEECCDFYSKNTDETCAVVESGTTVFNAPNDFAGFYRSLRDALSNNEQSTDETRKFVLCIDEINRGNISSIFGELITLIEESKRFGNGEYLSSKLPHSGDELIVPDNLYILGTMNTADRSLVKLDVALRRRFDFVSRYTDYALISDEQRSVIYSEHSLREVASTLNHQIRNLKKSNDYELGHYFFMNIDSPDDEYNSFNKKIIPLLHEYFQGSHEQMKQVLNWGGVTWDYDNETHQWHRV